MKECAKHKVKVEEPPGFPVTAAERGRRVLVREDEYMQVGDHDFTRFALIPSVICIINVPEDINDSRYTGTCMYYMYVTRIHFGKCTMYMNTVHIYMY